MESHGARTLADDHLFNFQVEEHGTHKSKGARYMLQVLFTPGSMVVRDKEGAIDEIRFKDILRCEPHESTDGEPTALRLQVAGVPSTGGPSRGPTWNSAAPTAWLEFLTVQTLILAGVCNVPADRLRRAAPNLSGLDNRVLRSGTLTRKSESFWGKSSRLYTVLTAHKLYLFVSPPRTFIHTDNDDDDAAATPEQHVRHVCFIMGATVQRRGCEVVIKPVKAKQMTLVLDSELEARLWTKDVSVAAAAAAAAEPTIAARTLALLHALSAYSSRGCTGELSLDDTPPPPYISQSSAAAVVVGEGSAATEVELPDGVTEAEVEPDVATEVQATADEQDPTAPPSEEHNIWHVTHLACDEVGVDAPASARSAVVATDHINQEPMEEEPLVDALEAAADAEAEQAAVGGDDDDSTVAEGGVNAATEASASFMCFLPVNNDVDTTKDIVVNTCDGAIPAEVPACVEFVESPVEPQQNMEEQQAFGMLVSTDSASVDITDDGAAQAAEATAEAAAQQLPPVQPQGDDDADCEPLQLSPAAAVLSSAVHSTEEAEAPDAATADVEMTEDVEHERQPAVEMPQYWCEPGDAPVAASAAAAPAAEVETAAEVELPDAITEAKTEPDVSTEAEMEPDAVTEVFYSAGGDESTEDHLPQAEAADDDCNSDAGSEATVESHAVAVVPPSAGMPRMHRAAGAAPYGCEGAVSTTTVHDSAHTYPAAVAATAGSMAMGMLAHATADGGEGGSAHVSGGASDGGGDGMLWSGMDVVLTPHLVACASSSAKNNNANAAVTTLHTVHASCSLTVTMQMKVTAGVAAAGGFVTPASSSAASCTASPLSMEEPSSTSNVAEVVVSNHIQPTAALEKSVIPPSEAVTVTMTTPPRASSSAAARQSAAPRTPSTPKPAQSGSNDVKHAAYVESVTCTPATNLRLLPPPQFTPLSGVEEQAVEDDGLPTPYATASYAELAGADVEPQTELPIQLPPPTATTDTYVECAHAAPSAVSSSPFKIADRKHLLASSSEATSFISPVGACKHKHAPSKPVWSPAGHTRRNH